MPPWPRRARGGGATGLGGCSASSLPHVPGPTATWWSAAAGVSLTLGPRCPPHRRFAPLLLRLDLARACAATVPAALRDHRRGPRSLRCTGAAAVDARTTGRGPRRRP